MPERIVPTIGLINERIQSGTASFVQADTVNVVFLIPFIVIPTVVITAIGDPINRGFIQNLTTTGFTVKTSGTSLVTFGWIAFSPL